MRRSSFLTKRDALEFLRLKAEDLDPGGFEDEESRALAEAVKKVVSGPDRSYDVFAKHFEVQGAGVLEVRGLSRTGTADGVSLGVSWGLWGYAGGVMDRKEVRRLIDHLETLIGDKPVVVG